MDLSARSAELLTAVRGGDRAALKRLLALYHPRLRARVVRKLPPDIRPKMSPEDILQEVYLEVARRLDEFRPDGRRGSFYRWLCRICGHAIVDVCRAFRSQARNVAREVRPAPADGSSYDRLLEEIPFSSVTPSRVIARSEQIAVLTQAIETLSDDHRRVLQLRYVEGRSVADVARAMRRSEPAIHMLLRRALVQLGKAARRLGLAPEDL
jgi:RNA polymerase sigma-70 factor (ECF subfamily)